MSESTASIDDLLRATDEPAPRPPRRRSGYGWLIRALLLAAAGTAAIVFGLRLFGIGLWPPVVFTGLLALRLLLRVTRQASPMADTDRYDGGASPGTDRSEEPGERDALRSSVNRWEARLSWSKGDTARFARITRPAIAEIADERLRLRHGLTRAGDPQRARKVLGETVWTFLTTPPKRTPAPRELAEIVAELEKI